MFLLFTVLPAVSSVAWAVEYPRRIAIAPFDILGPQEEIRQTVDILPRLISSRLMALAGAEVLLLPRGEKPAEDVAKQAGLPLLLKGTVAKLGAGYSIDVTVSDLSTGKTAGAFFASAETIDAIIPRLGDLAADISEKLFGVKSAVRAYPPPPAQPQAGVAAVQAPAAAAPATPQAAAPGPQPVSQPAPAAPSTPEQGWVPSSLEKIGQSDKIADELYGVVAGDVDAEENGEVIAWGRNVLYLYRVKGTEIVPFTRITKERSFHFLSVDAADLDGDGKKEILVTALEGDTLASHVFKKEGDVYRETGEPVPYFLAVLRDRQGKKIVVGQYRGIDTITRGKLVKMTWDGKTFREAGPLSADTDIKPLNQGILGLASATVGKDWKLLYTDDQDYLRVLDEGGKTEYKTKEKYGAGLDLFEWGPFRPAEGTRMQTFLRKPARVAAGPEGKPFVLIAGVEKVVLNVARYFETTRLVLLQWDGDAFVERAATKKSDHFYSGVDLFSSSGLRKGGKVIASMIEQEESSFKDKVSRLLLFRVE
jgi:hypothetical protein